MKRVAIYARVSTSDQSVLSQVMDLQRYASERDWEVSGVYIDEGVSGTKDSRPSLDKMMKVARKRKLDVVLVWRFDRFARSTKHLVLALEEFQSLKIDFVSYQESVDTTSPLGKAIFVIVSAVAQLERDIIAERVKSGLRRARANGVRLGRPALVDTDEIYRLRDMGLSHRAISRKLGVAHSTVGAVLRGGR